MTETAPAPSTSSFEDRDLPPTMRRGRPLVPTETIAGKALITVVAILTFLAALTATAALLVADASQQWRAGIAREVTIQLRPPATGDPQPLLDKAAQLARLTPGVAQVQVFSKADSERLLEPWLGTGLDLVELPVPRLVVLKLAEGGQADMPALRAALTAEVPGATLDDHRAWVTRLSAMANTVIAVGFVIVALVVAAAALAVGFATRGALAGAREIVSVLHFVGATDSYIAREFQSRFLRLGLQGGLIGGGLAALAVGAAGMLASTMRRSPGGDQLEALFGAFSIGWGGYAAIAAIILLIAAVTALVSRLTVRRQLGSML
jgi:cell division transport system permease protein